MCLPTAFEVFLVTTLFSNANVIALFLDKNLDNYGPYDLWWSRYEKCSGPKANNLTLYTTKLAREGEDYIAWWNFTFLTQVHIDDIKIRVNTISNNSSKLLLSYKIKNPCQHYAVAALIEKQWNAKNCLVKKGDYSCHVNLTEFIHIFFGNSFFYGEYMIIATVSSKKGNVVCLLINYVFSKKTTGKKIKP